MYSDSKTYLPMKTYYKNITIATGHNKFLCLNNETIATEYSKLYDVWIAEPLPQDIPSFMMFEQ
jgi:hypothetical protein